MDVAGPVVLELINRSELIRAASVRRAIEIPRAVHGHSAVRVQPVRPGEGVEHGERLRLRQLHGEDCNGKKQPPCECRGLQTVTQD